MNLRTECKKVDLTIIELSELVNVPVQTLRDWSLNRAQLLEILFSGIAANDILDKVESLRDNFNRTLEIADT
jgi:hypothetical protein